MNQPDVKHNENLYHPDMNPNFYHLERGFTAGTGLRETRVDWKARLSLVSLMDPIHPMGLLNGFTGGTLVLAIKPICWNERLWFRWLSRATENPMVSWSLENPWFWLFPLTRLWKPLC